MININQEVSYNGKKYICSGWNNENQVELEDNSTEPPNYFWVNEHDLDCDVEN